MIIVRSWACRCLEHHLDAVITSERDARMGMKSTPAFEGLGIVERHNSMQRHIRLIRAQRVEKDSAEDF